MSSSKIGSLNESSLHKNLKDLYTTADSVKETPVDGYYIDIVTPKRLIEIQTGNFNSIKKKLTFLLKKHPITIVFPLPVETTIKVFSKKGELMYKRKSPMRRNIKNAASELLFIPDLLLSPRLNLEIILVKQEEIRCSDGKGSWRRKGVSIKDKKLIDVIEKYYFVKPSDYLILLPKGLSKQFSNREIAKRLRKEGTQKAQCDRLASQISYLLRKLNLLKITGKEGNRLLFELIL